MRPLGKLLSIGGQVIGIGLTYTGLVIALIDVSLDVRAGEFQCLLGDNGAGKSTFIKTMSGVHQATCGNFMLEGKSMNFGSTSESKETGIATVFQDLAIVPLMSVVRNFLYGAGRSRAGA
jgi:simple sugar transport system ATP-binding protein